VAGGAVYEQAGGTNLLLSGGNVWVVGHGGAVVEPARIDATGGTLLAPSEGLDKNAYMILGKDRDAGLRIAESATVDVVVIEMNQDRAAGASATLQLDGGRLTVNRVTG